MIAPKLVHDAPDETVRQLSARDPVHGEPVVVVVAKRTYAIQADGRCRLHEVQQPLFDDLVLEDDLPDAALQHDCDLYIHKPMTDVVVLGHAHGRAGETQFRAGVWVGALGKVLQVTGDRTATMGPNGQPRFSPPAPIEAISLSYRNAYGGRDHVAEALHGNPYAALASYMTQADLRRASPYVYPRNPSGKGYLVEASPEAIEGLPLPNLEDPEDLLRPVALAAGAPGRWCEMPLPWSTAWVDPGTFPRIGLFGVIPATDADVRPFEEVRRQLAPSSLLQPRSDDPLHAVTHHFDPRCANGASLGLQLPTLAGNETITLARLHPRQERLVFALPGSPPKLFADGREGRLAEAKPVLHSVILEPDEDRVSLVWCGRARARRDYMPDELMQMPLRVQW